MRHLKMTGLVAGSFGPTLRLESSAALGHEAVEKDVASAAITRGLGSSPPKKGETSVAIDSKNWHH